MGSPGSESLQAYPVGPPDEAVNNDVVAGHPICVTFCPLTGTGLVFDGERADGSRLTLGVSGLLYNTNLPGSTETQGGAAGDGGGAGSGGAPDAGAGDATDATSTT